MQTSILTLRSFGCQGKVKWRRSYTYSVQLEMLFFTSRFKSRWSCLTATRLIKQTALYQLHSDPSSKRIVAIERLTTLSNGGCKVNTLQMAEARCGAFGKNKWGLCLGRSGLGSSGGLTISAASYNNVDTSSWSGRQCYEQKCAQLYVYFINCIDCKTNPRNVDQATTAGGFPIPRITGR